MPSLNSGMPRVVALFRVVFDQKVGYTIAWARSRGQDGTDADDDETKGLLEGVEFKSLPSGLHEVEQDVVYFVHESTDSLARFGGVSCFMRKEADAAHRHAAFTSVGALVSLEDDSGRLGRAWDLVDTLKNLCANVNEQDSEGSAELLQTLWESLPKPTLGRNAAAGTEGEERVSRSPDATDELMQKNHPSLTIPSMLDTFGPLIFPLYRAAMLRKRILLVNTPPVLETCNFCYSLSVLSVLPPAMRDLVANYETHRLTTIPTLFSIGIHDLTWLQATQRNPEVRTQGWIATTTDSIIATKKDLFDLLVEMPAYRASAASRAGSQWPSLRTADGKVVKASQRDLKAYLFLLRQRSHLKEAYRQSDGEAPEALQDTADTAPLMDNRTQHVPGAFLDDNDGGEFDQQHFADIVEAQPWSHSIYRSLAWFTSAGEMSSFEEPQLGMDRESVALIPSAASMPPAIAQNNALRESWLQQKQATQATSYFHAQTSHTIKTIDELVHEADEGSHDEYDPACDVHLTNDSLARLDIVDGLHEDHEWAIGMFSKWTGRVAEVHRAAWEVCGVRIC